MWILGDMLWYYLGDRNAEDKARMHDNLTVAVIAMNKDGDVGAASTLGSQNVHRGRPAFPFVVSK